nr:putative F-box protein At5g62660 [Ipomoea batatas]
MDATTTCIIASLPQEIILKILTTLPPKSALSFKCTSKFFHSSIPHPHFAFRILFSFPSATHPINLYTVGYTEESHGRLQATSLQCSEKLQSFEGLDSSSFADGKLCLFNIHGEITLWDLSTRQHISLPRTTVRPGYEGPEDPWRRTFSSAVLDFDPISKRYKKIKLQIQMNNPSTSSSTSITSLPQEILLKILTGLPAKSAVRFRCTSKFFYSFIPDPRFEFRILVSLPSKSPSELNLYSVTYREDSHGNLQADTAQRLDVPGLVRSADGKMCLLSTETRGDAVFDLSTGRLICLPRIRLPDGRAALSITSCICSIKSLGFDSVSERYKVFKTVVYYDYDCRQMLNRLWILTVGVDKSWREIDSTILGYTGAVVHIHGIMYLIHEPITEHWTRLSLPFNYLFHSSSTEPKIVAMDIATERFITSIPFPFECYSAQHNQGWRAWMKLKGRLAFINILCPQKDGVLTPWPDRIEIWRLERSMKWEKQIVVLPLEEREVIREATSMKFTTNSMGEIVFLIQSKKMMSPLVLIYSFGREKIKLLKKPSTSITSLPQEILLKILTGLPAKCAVRFRCTSKFFYSFIPDPRFEFRILVSLPSELNLYSVSYREDSHGNLQADTAQRLDVRGLVSSADGKMCLLSPEWGGEAVFDLSTGRRILLPMFGFPAGRSTMTFRSCDYSNAFLVFDSVSERYKVFKSAVNYDYDGRWVLSRLWVLTVGVDNSWREIDSSIIVGNIEAVLNIHGIIYLIPGPIWSVIESKIVTMDVATECFITSIRFPFGFKGWEAWIKLNDRLAFINILRPQKDYGAPNWLNIWRLERSMQWEKQKVVMPLEEEEVIGEATSIEFTVNSMGDIVFLVQSQKMLSPLVLVYSYGREIWRRDGVKLSSMIILPNELEDGVVKLQ